MEPLAWRYRPNSLDEFIGQEHLVGQNGPIRRFIKEGYISSMIFWGPPGVGKTTLAYILAKTLNYEFFTLSAVMDGKAQLKKILQQAQRLKTQGKRSVLFIDEIHRWSKAQQDALLPFVESGLITLIGATTENPGFTVISPLLSRCHVFVFKPLSTGQIKKRLQEVAKKEGIKLSDKAASAIAEYADGDVRVALNVLEFVINAYGKDVEITPKLISDVLAQKLRYDRDGENHYNLISAVHKSLRASDPLAASYYIMRMLEAGEDPLYIARRLLRFASEDVGNAKPAALLLALAAYDTCERVGMPECAIFLIQTAMYLAEAPKDNSAFDMEVFTKYLVRKYGNLPVPLHFRNAPVDLLKKLGYGKGYKYDHDFKDKNSGQQTLPDKLHKLLKGKSKPWRGWGSKMFGGKNRDR